MKQPKLGRAWFFVDESGDPQFYSRRGKLIIGQNGCSPILILGFIKTRDPQPIRAAITDLRREILDDPYLRGLPSLSSPEYIFHAKDDVPEVRYRLYQLIASLDFSAQVIVARKNEERFIRQNGARQNAFYDDVVSCLFERVLHLYEENHIYFAKRSRPRQAPLTAAIQRGRERFEQFCGVPITTSYVVQAQTPSGEPCLSIVDYINWSIYRAYTTGEMRYFNKIRHKVSLVADIYAQPDETQRQRGSVYFDRKNPFDINKITPLQLVPS